MVFPQPGDAGTLLTSNGPTAIPTWKPFTITSLDASALSPGSAGQVLQTNATPSPTWTTVTGDTTINSSGVTATGKINGASVPAAGSLVTGNVLQVSGASALTYGLVSSTAGITPGISGQVLWTPNGSASTLWSYEAYRNAVTADLADPTGSADSSSAIHSCLTTASASHQCCWLPPGTYKANSSITVPSNSCLIGQKGMSTINGNLGIHSNPGNAVLLATYTSGVFSATLHTNSAVGSPVVCMTASPSANQIVGIQSVSATLREARYTVVSSSAGAGGCSGNFSVTLDRPVLMSFVTGDNVIGYATTPVNIYVGSVNLAGVADRMLEFNLTSRSLVEDVFLSPTAASDIVASFDIGGYDDAFHRVYLDGSGVAGTAAGIALETNESSRIVSSEVRNLAHSGGYGIALYDSVDCSVIDSHESNASNGLGFVADGDTIGCIGSHVLGGNYTDNAQYGVIIGNGSTGTGVNGVSAENNGTNGIYDNGGGGTVITGGQTVGNGNAGLIAGTTGTSPTIVQGLYSSGNTNFDVEVTAPADLTGVRSYANAAGAGSIYVANSAGQVNIRGLLAEFVSGNGVRVGTGDVVNITSSKIIADASLTAVDIFGTARVSDTTITGCNIGLKVEGGGALRLGTNVDGSGCTSATNGAYETDFGGATLSEDGSGNPTLTPSATGILKLGDGVNTTNVYLNVNGGSIAGLSGGSGFGFWNASTFEPASAGGLTLGTTSLPFGAAYFGAGNGGYTVFAATGGAHNSQDGIEYHQIVEGRLSSYSSANFNSYTLSAAHHGWSYACKVVARVVTQGLGGGCAFWGSGQGVPDITYRTNFSWSGYCTASNTCTHTGSGFYDSVDTTTSGETLNGTTLAHPAVIAFGTPSISGLTFTLGWQYVTDSGGPCTGTIPVLDLVSDCTFLDN